MSQTETLMARDGHTFTAYIAKPAGSARGGVVIAHEIFGLTASTRHTADSYAAAGYLAVAPALFDRVHRDLVLGYSPAEAEQGMGYRRQIEPAKALLDIAAAVAVVRHAGRVAVIGFCWGGLLAWLAARDIALDAAIAYYGVRIGEQLDKLPACPMMLHFGDHDPSIPRDEISRVHSAFPAGIFHTYDAGHAFANEDRVKNYNAAAAALARTHSLDFLSQHVG